MNTTQFSDQYIGIDTERCMRRWTQVIYSCIITKEPVDTGRNTSTHGFQIISTLLYHNQAPIAEILSQFNDNTGELRKASCRNIHLTQRVTPVRVKTGGDQDELRIKAVSRWCHHLPENWFICLET